MIAKVKLPIPKTAYRPTSIIKKGCPKYGAIRAPSKTEKPRNPIFIRRIPDRRYPSFLFWNSLIAVRMSRGIKKERSKTKIELPAG